MMDNRGRFQVTVDYGMAKTKDLPTPFLPCLSGEHVDPDSKTYYCHNCGQHYSATVPRQWDSFYGFSFWEAKCPKCGTLNEMNDCYWR